MTAVDVFAAKPGRVSCVFEQLHLGLEEGDVVAGEPSRDDAGAGNRQGVAAERVLVASPHAGSRVEGPPAWAPALLRRVDAQAGVEDDLALVPLVAAAEAIQKVCGDPEVRVWEEGLH